jgi:hypothetical protein
MFKIGERVVYGGTGPDAGTKGTVTHVFGNQFEVRWDDGEVIDYTHNIASVIRRLSNNRAA